MQYANAHGAAGTSAGGATKGGLGHWVAGVVQAIRARAEERTRYLRTREELSALTERELHDIGLGRGDIEHVARRSARARV